MKAIKNILGLILLITVLTFTSCNKDDDDPSNDSSNNKITLTIDNGSETVYTNITGVVLADKLTIGAQNSDSDIQIILNSDISQGTYTSAAQIGMSYGVNSQAIFTSITNATSLSFVVTSHDTGTKHIKGTFSVNYTDNQDSSSHTATGTYDVKYH